MQHWIVINNYTDVSEKRKSQETQYFASHLACSFFEKYEDTYTLVLFLMVAHSLGWTRLHALEINSCMCTWENRVYYSAFSVLYIFLSDAIWHLSSIYIVVCERASRDVINYHSMRGRFACKVLKRKKENKKIQLPHFLARTLLMMAGSKSSTNKSKKSRSKHSK